MKKFVLLLLIVMLFPTPAIAQDDTRPYSAYDGGLNFELPVGWEVAQISNQILMADSADKLRYMVNVFTTLDEREVPTPVDGLVGHVEVVINPDFQTPRAAADFIADSAINPFYNSREFTDITVNELAGIWLKSTDSSFQMVNVQTNTIVLPLETDAYLIVTLMDYEAGANDTLIQSILDSMTVDVAQLRSAVGLPRPPLELTQEVLVYDGALSMRLPEGWVLVEDGAELGILVVADSEETLATMAEDEVPESGAYGTITLVLREINLQGDLVNYLQTELGSLGLSEPVALRTVPIEGLGTPIAWYSGPANVDGVPTNQTIYVYSLGGILIVARYISFDTERQATFEAITRTVFFNSAELRARISPISDKTPEAEATPEPDVTAEG